MFFKLFRKHKDLSDLELVQEFQKTHDIRFCAKLYERYADYIAAISLKYCPFPEEAEDAAMEVFEIMLTDLKKYEIRNPKNWLYSVVRHNAYRKAKEKRKYLFSEDEFFSKHVENEDFFSPNEKWELESKLNTMENAMENIAPEQKLCLELFYLDGKSYKEIDEITNYGLNKIKSYIQNGKRKIKVEFDKQADFG